MSTTPALLAAAGGVGFGHAILPDHWVPLAVVARTRSLPLVRVARLSALAGIAHVLVSVILGGLIILVGLPLRHAVEHAQDVIVGSLLIATGVGFLVLELAGRGHGHRHMHGHGHGHDHHHDHGSGTTPAPASEHEHGHEHEHEHEHGPSRPPSRLGALAAIMVPFGAAASPDLTILPVFLAATAVGTGAAIGSVLVFALATITTIVGLTLAAAAGGYQLRAAWLDRWGNLFTALILVVIGLLVLTGVL